MFKRKRTRPVKPDVYMPFYGNDLESALKGYAPALKWSYVAALWHYWHHTHCDGLPNEDEYLRNVCDCAQQDWARTKGVIFGSFFTLQAGKWHQERCREEYLESVRICKLRAENGTKGAASRWQTDGKPDGKPEANEVTKTCHSESESVPSLSAGKIEPPPGFPKSESEAKASAQFCGVSEKVALKAYHKAVSRGYTDSKGNVIRDFRSHIKSEQMYEDDRNARNASTSDRNKGTANEGRAQQYDLKKIRPDCVF